MTLRLPYANRDSKILSLWDHGLSVRAIAERFGMSASGVSYILTKGGKDISIRRHRYDSQDGGSVGHKASGRGRS